MRGRLGGKFLPAATRRIPSHHLIALALASLAPGCVHYQAKPISAAGTRDAFEARTLDAPGLAAYVREQSGAAAWPPASWDLPSLTAAAFYYSPDLDAARARWGVARAGEVTAGARPNPDASLLLGYNADAAPGVTPWIPEAVLDIPIETAGKRGIRISEARQLSESARLDVLSAAWEVRARLREAFVDLSAAGRMRDLLAEKIEIQEESVRVLQARLDAGDISPNEMANARVDLDSTRLALLDTNRRRAEARVRLAGAIGVPAAALEGAVLSFDALDGATIRIPENEIRRRALVSRPDILRGLSEYEAAQQALRLEIAKQYPDIRIGPGFQLDQTDAKWTLGVTLALPVFNRNRGPIAEAEAKRAEAAASFLSLQARVLGEIDAAEAACRAASESGEAAGAMLAELARREAAAKAAYEIGEISKLAYLGVRLEAISGEISRLETLSSARKAQGDLESAIQDPRDLAEWVLEAPVRASTKAGEEPGGAGAGERP